MLNENLNRVQSALKSELNALENKMMALVEKSELFLLDQGIFDDMTSEVNNLHEDRNTLRHSC